MKRFINAKAGRIVLAIGAAGAASAIGVLAVPATFGGFTSSASNPGNSVAAGTLQMTDSVNGAVVTASTAGMDPSNRTGFPNTETGTVTITNSGSLPATMTLSVANIANLACASCPTGVGTSTDLSGEVTLKLQEGTRTPIINSVTVDAAHTASPYTLTPTSGTQWAPAESHTYAVTITLPSTADDTYQGTSSTFDLNWTGAS